MDIETTVSEFIGNVADLVVSLQSGSITQGDLVSVFHIAGMENPRGDDYTRSDRLITKAYVYHSSNGKADTASNIKTVFTRKDGQPIIP